MTPAPRQPLVEASDVHAAFGERAVLRGVALSVAAGELWVVLGPNGAGKSTLLRTLLGLHSASGGRIHLLGRALPLWPRSELARVLAWVPQIFEPVFGFSGLEVVAMGRSPHLGLWGIPTQADIAQARAAMEELGIAQLAGRPANAMSGGEQRLLLLARAFVQEPRLLFLDEPTAFLDLRHQVETLRALKLRTQRGLAAVAVLHDVNLAAAFADRVLLLEQGRVLASGEAGEVLTAPMLERLYGVPMTEVTGVGGQPLFAPRLSS
jgi:iron complex transport system ATP-binding protein